MRAGLELIETRVLRRGSLDRANQIVLFRTPPRAVPQRARA
ncbi:MAG TPA: hypothetical protein VIX82_12280 [Solirubrobacteraceae bacterium]